MSLDDIPSNKKPDKNGSVTDEALNRQMQQQGGDPSKTQVFAYLQPPTPPIAATQPPVNPVTPQPPPVRIQIVNSAFSPSTPPPPPGSVTSKPPANPLAAPPDGMPVEIPEMAEMEMVRKPTAKSGLAGLPWKWIIPGAMVLLILLIILPKGRTKPGEKDSTKSTEIETGENNTDRATTVVPAVKQPVAEPWQYFELTDEPLWGSAPYPAPEAKVVVSPQADAATAALIQALKLRIDVLVEPRTVRRGKTTIRTINGNVSGFIVNASESGETPDTMVLDVTVTTPKRAVLKSRNRQLTSLRNITPEQFSEDLQKAGFDIIVNPGGERPDSVYVRLVQRDFPQVSADYLIADNWAGPLQAGIPVGNVNSVFPPDYITIRKRLRIGDGFQELYKVHDQNQHPLLFIYEKSGHVDGVSLISDRYRTARAIGITSTLAQMLLNYGKVKFAYLPGRDTVDTVARVDGMDVVFYFENEKIDFPARQFSLGARIVSVLIGRIPVIEGEQ